MVQEAASKAWDSKVHLSDVLIDTAAVAELMDAREVRRCFDRSRYLSATSVIIGRLKDLET
jgi:adenylosuccinate lyase